MMKILVLLFKYGREEIDVVHVQYNLKSLSLQGALDVISSGERIEEEKVWKEEDV